LFAVGRFAEINNVLNETEIDEDIATYEAKGEILANEIMIKAQAIVVNRAESWFEEADRLYAKAMRIIEDYNTTYNYAHFLHKHRHYSRGAKIYEKALTYVSNEIEKAATLNGLAQLAAKNPQKYLPDLAETLYNFASLQFFIREYDAAEKSFLETLTNYRQLAQRDTENHLPGLAKTIYMFAALQYSKKEYKAAIKSYLEAIPIYRKLAESDPQNYSRNLAGTLVDLANTLDAKKEYEAAKKHYLEALTIFRKLAKVNLAIFNTK